VALRKALFVDVDGVGAVSGAPCADASAIMLIADDAVLLHLDRDAQVNCLWDHEFRQLCTGMLSLLVMAISPHKGLCKVAEVAAVRVVLVPLDVLVD